MGAFADDVAIDATASDDDPGGGLARRLPVRDNPKRKAGCHVKNTSTVLVSMCTAALGAVLISTVVHADVPSASDGGDSSIKVVEKATTKQSALRLGLRGVHFVRNQGQWSDETIHYGFRSRGMDIAFSDSALTMYLRREQPLPACMLSDPAGTGLEQPGDIQTLALAVTFPGSNLSTPVGVNLQPTEFNYFVGDDSSRWRSNVPSFGGVVYHDLYDGIDLRVSGSDEGVLKYEFLCAPGSDHGQIRIHYDGIDTLRIDEIGNLLIRTSFGTLSDGAPIVWQERPNDGAGDSPVHHIPARFETLDARTYTVSLLADTDPSLPLVIDPEVLWMTYLGGSDQDRDSSVALDGNGDALVTGRTISADFEGQNNSNHGDWDVFLLKVDSSSQLQWMTYLGGSREDSGSDIAVDSAGRSVITGSTNSSDFAGATNSYHGGNRDGFALQVDSSGNLQWMTYVGGSQSDTAVGIAVDSRDDVCVTGDTWSADFAGAGNSFQGHFDVFALKLSPSGELQWMVFLGGSDGDGGFGIAADANLNLMISGRTRSLNFAGATNSHHGGVDDGFALKLSRSGQIQWMTYLGGSDEDFSFANACDANGNVLVVGFTKSLDFEGRDNSNHGGARDAFVLKIDSSAKLQWMIYLGGSDSDSARSVAVNSAGDAMVAGDTDSIDFDGRINTFHGGESDGLALEVRSDGSLQWMTYLGGSDRDLAKGIPLDGSGNAFVSGFTDSVDIAGGNNEHHGVTDAFLFKIRLDTDPRQAEITDVTVTIGSLLSGGVPELLESDDEYVRARSSFGFSAAEPNLIDLRIGAQTDVESPGSADLLIESRINVPGGRARLRLRNWNTNGFEFVHVYAVEVSDTIENVFGVGLGDRVRDADGRIELSIHYSVLATFSTTDFDAFFDHVTITVN